ncbi:MAG: NIPSNAP family protein [Steroidobacteraceae bacterium]
MIIDYRAYSFRPGTVQDFVEMFRAEGLPIQNRILGKDVFAGLFTTEIGDVNEVIHLWRYRDAEDRARRRALLYDDREFMDYVAKARQIIVKQDVRLLNEIDFGPPRSGSLVYR